MLRQGLRSACWPLVQFSNALGPSCSITGQSIARFAAGGHFPGSRSPPDLVWPEILNACARDSTGNKLREVCDVLHRHCLQTKSSPPLKHFNELLRLCAEHKAQDSQTLLIHLMEANKMQLDSETYGHLNDIYSYFPPPFSKTRE